MGIEKEKTSQSEKILLAAYELIASRGYANVSLRDIAEEAGVVLSQLNYYYKNKEGLFTEVMNMIINKYMLAIEELFEQGTTSKEKLLSLTKYFQQILATDPKLFRILYDLTGMALWSSPFSQLLSNLFKNLSNLIEVHIVKAGASKSMLKGCSSNAMATMILGSFLGTAIQIVLNPEQDLSDSLNAISTILG